MLIPLISIAVSATLLPVVLDAAGPALEWPRRRPARTVSTLWTGIARRVTARPGWSAAGALAVLAVLIVPVFSLNLGEPQATATAATAPASARAGLDALVSSSAWPSSPWAACRSPTSRSCPPGWPPGSSSTPPSSAASSPPPWSPCSAGPTGGCPGLPPGCCA
jgi:putative drug exporter of the RND superfamily